MSKKTRSRFSVPEKVAILRLHLLKHTPVSDLCDQHGIHPTRHKAEIAGLEPGESVGGVLWPTFRRWVIDLRAGSG